MSKSSLLVGPFCSYSLYIPNEMRAPFELGEARWGLLLVSLATKDDQDVDSLKGVKKERRGDWKRKYLLHSKLMLLRWEKAGFETLVFFSDVLFPARMKHGPRNDRRVRGGHRRGFGCGMPKISFEK